MEIKTCCFCGKIYSAIGKEACASCRKELDRVYETARIYIRDNPKLNLTPEALAEAIGEDLRMIQHLKNEGRFSEADEQRSDMAEDERRQELLKELQSSLQLSDEKNKKGSTATSFTGERHGRS